MNYIAERKSVPRILLVLLPQRQLFSFRLRDKSVFKHVIRYFRPIFIFPLSPFQSIWWTRRPVRTRQRRRPRGRQSVPRGGHRGRDPVPVEGQPCCCCCCCCCRGCCCCCRRRAPAGRRSCRGGIALRRADRCPERTCKGEYIFTDSTPDTSFAVFSTV